MSVGTLFFAFLALAFFIAVILIFIDSDKIIPDKFKRFRDDDFYNVWRNFYGAGLLVMVSAFVLLAICFSRKNFDTTTLIFLISGILMFVLGCVIVYIFNKKALNKFDPAFYSRNNLDKQKKNKKISKKFDEENNKRYENYRKDNK